MTKEEEEEKLQQEIQQIKNLIIPKLLPDYIPQQIPARLYDNSNKIQQLIYSSMINKDVSTGFLIGPPSSGKSLALEYSLRNLEEVEKMKIKRLYIDGNWVKNENSCLNQIKQQFVDLHKNEQIEDEEIEDENIQEDFSKTFDFLVEEILNFSMKKYKTVIVLDNFDKIVDNAPKSIYHILDSGHFKDINLAIICLTNDYNILSKLDKRTVSRLMSRKIYFNCLNSIEEYKNIFKEYLIIQNKIWNDSIHSFLNNEIFCDLIRIRMSYGIIFFKNIMRNMIVNLNQNFIEIKNFEDLMNKLTLDTRMERLLEIPTNDLLLLLVSQDIENKQDITDSVTNSISYLYSQFRQFITGSTNYIEERDRLKKEKILTKIKLEEKDLKRSLNNLVELKFIKLKGNNWSLNLINPNEIKNFIKLNSSSFSTEINKFIS
eukprot:gene12836-7186_t